MSDSTLRRVAVLMDFENIVLGLPQQIKFKPKAIMGRVLDEGKVLVKRAYADWARHSKDKVKLHELGFDLLDLPKRSMTGKNSADIRMVVDAMDMVITSPHIDTFALVTGDSDFTPLVAKLREHDKHVIGIGVKQSSSKLLIDSCDEFVFYDEIAAVDHEEVRKSAGARLAKTAKVKKGRSNAKPERRAEALYLVLETAQGLLRSRDFVWSSQIKQTIVRKHPSFDEGYHGYATFTQLVEDAVSLDILVGSSDSKHGNYRITDIGKAGQDLIAKA